MEIVFTTNNKIISLLIKWSTSSLVSHVAIRYGGDESNWMIESTGARGVFPSWWNYFKKVNKVIASFEIITNDEKKIEEIVDKVLDDYVGKNYDYFAVIGLLICIVVKLISFGKIDCRNFLGSKKAFFCSEFVYKVSKAIEKEMSLRIYKGLQEELTPDDLLQQSWVNSYLKDVSKKYLKL